MSWVILMLGLFVGTIVGIFVVCMCRMAAYAKSREIVNDRVSAPNQALAPSMVAKPADCEHSRRILVDA
jgi:hypothetical protein